MTIKQRLFRHPLLFAISLFIGIGIIGVGEVLYCEALGRPIEVQEPIISAINALLTALPFLALSARGKQHLMTWTLGIIPTLWLAWWWLQKGIAYQRSPDGSGVDLGGAVLMLFSPFVITVACLIIDEQLRRREPNGN